MNTETLEQIKHKIWSPVPVKLRKIDDGHSQPRAVIVKENQVPPMTLESARVSLKSFDPTNSAFKYILAGSNKANTLELAPSRSSLSNTSALTADTACSDKSADNEIASSAFHRTLQKICLNIDQELFAKQVKQVENFNFRMNFNTYNENPSTSAKPLQTLAESLFTQDYAKLLGGLCKPQSACETPQEEKEEVAHKCGKHGKTEGLNNKISQFLKPSADKKKTRHCNCKNSKCLKLYCECLAYGEYCDDQCNCCDCSNTVQKEEVRAYALSMIIEKRPEILEGEGIKKQKSSKMVRGKGCNCKKSACLKKYCECFNAGGGCGPHCKCEGCKNPHSRNETSESIKDADMGSPIMPEIMKGLGLSLKSEAGSDKLGMEIESQLLKTKKMPKKLPLFGREPSDSSNSPLPVFSSLSFGNAL